MEPFEAYELTAHERSLIDFEREWWMLGEKKNVEIRSRFAMSSSSYYRALHAVTAREEAMSYDPLTVLRLRKRREQARRDRIEGRRADPGSR
jgi:hypothetical protein